MAVARGSWAGSAARWLTTGAPSGAAKSLLGSWAPSRRAQWAKDNFGARFLSRSASSAAVGEPARSTQPGHAAGEPRDLTGLTLPSGIAGWNVVIEAANGQFSHGSHLLHDTLASVGGANDVHHFISENRNEIVMVCSAGENVCGHQKVVHGGFVALLFDNAFATLGFANLKFPVTKELCMKYLSPIQAGSNLLLKGRVVNEAPRKQDSKGREVRFFEGALFLQEQFAGGVAAATGKEDEFKPLVISTAQMVDVGGEGDKLPPGWSRVTAQDG